CAQIRRYGRGPSSVSWARGASGRGGTAWRPLEGRLTHMGSSASKAALAATTEEPTEPGPKHLAGCSHVRPLCDILLLSTDLTQYINETNMSVAHLADILSKKTSSSSWVVVFKALVTVHHLMVHGNERFIRHLASRHSLFTLHNFLDKSVVEGSAMSIFIRRYSRYLNERSLAYRQIASDITKVKRGARGMMRSMDTDGLLNTLPVIQTQLDALLSFAADPDEISNNIVHAAFRLLLRDALRLFAAYNEGVLNLLGNRSARSAHGRRPARKGTHSDKSRTCIRTRSGLAVRADAAAATGSGFAVTRPVVPPLVFSLFSGKYFDMRRSQCRESVELYAKFLGRTAKLTRFLKVAEVPAASFLFVIDLCPVSSRCQSFALPTCDGPSARGHLPCGSSTP
ncbi:Phosphatidylinositol-binding clathrin assembly protein, partial [Galemys pyrenaicus]